MFSSAEWNVLVNFFAPAFDAKFQKSSIKYSNEQSSSGRSRYRSYVPLNLSDSTVPIPEFKGAVTMSITHTDAISSNFEYRDTIFPRATLIKGFISMTNAEGKRAGGPDAYREFRDADDLLTDLKNLFPGVRALHKQPEKKMQATLLRALCVLEEDSQAGSVVPGMEPTPEQQALEARLRRTTQLLQQAEEKLETHNRQILHYETLKETAVTEEKVLDNKIKALKEELKKLTDRIAINDKNDEIERTRIASVQAMNTATYNGKQLDEAHRLWVDISNHRVQCLTDKKKAEEKLKQYKAKHPDVHRASL